MVEASARRSQQLEIRSAPEAALLAKMAADRVADRGKFLRTPHAPEPQHRALASSKRQVRIFRAIVGPSAHLTVAATAEIFQRCAI